MSKTAEMLDAVKVKTGIKSNYGLAKFLEIEEARIGEYYRSISKPDDYAVMRIALVLELEPINVLAEIRAESERNPKKREFWINFLTRAAMHCALAVGLSLGLSETSEAMSDEAQAKSGTIEARHNVQIMRFSEMLAALARWLFGAPLSEVADPA